MTKQSQGGGFGRVHRDLPGVALERAGSVKAVVRRLHRLEEKCAPPEDVKQRTALMETSKPSVWTHLLSEESSAYANQRRYWVLTSGLVIMRSCGSTINGARLVLENLALARFSEPPLAVEEQAHADYANWDVYRGMSFHPE